MELPKMRYSSRIKKTVQDKFAGYQHALDAGEGDIWDMQNLSSRFAPLLAPRQTRKLVKYLQQPNGLFAMEKLAWVDGEELYYDGQVRGTVENGKKRFAALGDYIIILPDKVYYDTKEARAAHTAVGVGSESAAVGEIYLREAGENKYNALRKDTGSFSEEVKGGEYGEIMRYGEEPYGLLYWNGSVWEDIGHKSFGTLEQSVTISGARIKDGFLYGEWAEANCIYSESVNFKDYFRVGDAVKITGMTEEKNNKTPIIREISEDGHSLYFSEYVFELEESGRVEETDPEPMHAQLTGTRYVGTTVTKNEGENVLPYSIDQNTAITASETGAVDAVGKYFIQLTDGEAEGVSGSVYYEITEASFTGRQLDLTLQATRSMVYMEEWSITVERSVPDMDYMCSNENRLWGCRADSIYASKPGDPFNWNVFDGLASDSWAVDAGSPGDFTACVSYLGYPVFFKEHRIYKVYGTAPGNFELISSATSGVDGGSGNSLAIAGETLFYMAPSGVTAYSGAVPAQINEAFGAERYNDAVGGTDGLKYYVSMLGADGWRLFVYDTQRGMWHREDDIEAVGFARTTEGTYMLCGTGELYELESESEEVVQWWAEFGDFTEGDPNRKGVSRMQIRLQLDKGAKFRAEINFDSQKRWDTVMNITGTREKQSFVIPIIPRRADHWRLRLSGSGQCVVYSIAREFYRGSDWR